MTLRIALTVLLPLTGLNAAAQTGDPVVPGSGPHAAAFPLDLP